VSQGVAARLAAVLAWSFFDIADVHVGGSVAVTLGFLGAWPSCPGSSRPVIG
jgi:hypothetical protein